MSKTIKFNLVCDGFQIRTLEDLRNHFSIEDILQYFRDQILEKWLCVRGYNKELEAVKSITSKSPYEIIKELVSIFDVESDNNTIEYATSVIKYRESRVLLEKRSMEELRVSDSLYNEYFMKYEDLVNNIIINPTNKNIIQATIAEIEKEYPQIFKMDYRNFFYKVRDISPLAVLCLLMNQFTRRFYIFDGVKPENKSLYTRDVEEMFNWIQKSFFKKEFIESLGNNVVIKNNETGSRFVSLTQKKCLVIKLHSYGDDGCAISNYTENESFLKPSQINGKFLIMEGIQYQSNTKNKTLYYIEI